MSPRTSTQVEELRKERKDLIIEAALELFADKSFHATSVSMIAHKAGISKGLMYNYFDSKEALLKEIIMTASGKILDSFDPDHDGILTINEFFYFLHASFSSVRENLKFWKLYTTMALQTNVVEEIIKSPAIDVPDITSTLKDFFQRSGFQDPEGEMLIFSSILKGSLIMYITAPDVFSLEKFEEKLINFYKERLHLKYQT